MLKKKILWLLLFAILAAAFGAGVIVHNTLSQPLAINASERLEVREGDGLYSLMRRMAAEGYIQRPERIVQFNRLRKGNFSLTPGLYQLHPGMGLDDLFEKLRGGDIIMGKLTIVEGRNLMQVIDLIKDNDDIRKTLPELTAGQIREALSLEQTWPEGLFLAATYPFPAGTSEVRVLEIANGFLVKSLQAAWEGREEGLPYKTPYDALIVASLVEKETAVVAERPEIAGVFINRLRKGMPLQTDPTIIYGLTKAGTYEGNLKRIHLRDPSNPYNTYQMPGLPPTPIAMVGPDALQAVMHPNKTSNLYFVAKGDGSHYFSKTYAEHQRAVRKYQIEQRRKDYRATPE